jgi:hypothetical protein
MDERMKTEAITKEQRLRLMREEAADAAAIAKRVVDKYIAKHVERTKARRGKNVTQSHL